MIRIKGGEIRVGQPLPWDCYDQGGVLLLRRGTVVSSERQLETLMERGLFVNNRADEVGGQDKGSQRTEYEITSPFHIVDEFKRRLKGIFEVLANRQAEEWPARVLKLCQDLQALCDKDADAALASLHLDHEGRYTIVHPLHVAILSEMIGRKKNLPAEQRLTMLAAALTGNISMIELQEVLHRQQAPLTDAQREEIRMHPLVSVDLLLELGVKEDPWIKTVLHHHEKIDGSGYPGALRGDDIPLLVRIVSLADAYSAMVTPRSYRNQILARDALRDIFLKRGSEVDAELAGLFIKELGVFPPGAFVRLKNGEIAVVIRRGANATAPVVQSVVGPRGAPLPTPFRRDCNEPRYIIHEMVARDRGLTLNLHRLWGYH